MSKPRNDANCLNCNYKKTCGKAIYKDYDLATGKPFVNCYGYEKEMTEEDLRNSNWSNLI